MLVGELEALPELPEWDDPEVVVVLLPEPALALEPPVEVELPELPPAPVPPVLDTTEELPPWPVPALALVACNCAAVISSMSIPASFCEDEWDVCGRSAAAAPPRR